MTNPFQIDGTWLRCALHAHTTRSDGELQPDALVDLGLRHAKRALEIDPDFAAAWSALADCHILRCPHGSVG